MPTEPTARGAESGWALRLETSAARALAALRLEPGIEAAIDGESIWVRGRGGDDEFHCRLHALPALGRFRWAPPDLLIPSGSRIPSGRLPNLRWQSLAGLLPVVSHPARLPGRIPGRVELRLVEGSVEREATLLRTDLESLQESLRWTPRLRWSRWSFAVSMHGSALVRGAPLPALPGERWVQLGRLFVPAGRRWIPEVEPAVVERLFSVAANEWVLLAPVLDGPDEGGFAIEAIRLTDEQFLPVTPSAVRATLREVAA